jgi:hypothetical protein
MNDIGIEDLFFLDFNDMWPADSELAFRRNKPPSSSVSKN